MEVQTHGNEAQATSSISRLGSPLIDFHILQLTDRKCLCEKALYKVHRCLVGKIVAHGMFHTFFIAYFDET